MRITVLCTDPRHPVLPWLLRWEADMEELGHSVDVVADKASLGGGDMLFLVSCTQILRESERSHFKHVLVLHASDLPRGRGWSPHVWSIVEGNNAITVCVLEAREPVDSGDVWFRTTFHLDGHELLNEINSKLFAAELELMSLAVNNLVAVKPVAQVGEPGAYLRKRTPEDSRLWVDKPLSDQFDLLRVVDNHRYPAFFEHRGCRYTIKIEKDHEAPK